MTKLLILSLVMLFSSCAALWPERSFIDEMDNQVDDFFVAGKDFKTTPGDTGRAHRSSREISMRTPASAKDAEKNLFASSMKRELFSKEKKLTPSEYNFYADSMPLLETDTEKIYFLDLTPGERKEYINLKNGEGMREEYSRRGRSISSHKKKRASRRRSPKYQNPYQFITSARSYDRDIFMGMGKGQVEKVWGRPSRIDVAGDPKYQNERWTFHKNGRAKYVYFERGEVNGWVQD